MTSPRPSYNDRPATHRSQSLQPYDARVEERQSSFSSESSTSSQVTTLSVGKRSPYGSDDARAAASASSIASTSSLASTLKAPSSYMSADLPLRQTSPGLRPPSDYQQHKTRQHSQGFFEPSLPTASYNNSLAAGSLSASQIAAQAAMQVQNPVHARRRSQTIPEPQPTAKPVGRRQVNFPTPLQTSPLGFPITQPSLSANAADGRVSATSAATAAFPRSPLYSPSLTVADHVPSPASDKDQKQAKERSRRKIFSKPKAIMTSKDKEAEKKNQATSSPNKLGTYSSNALSRLGNLSTTSLTDPSQSGSSSLYSSANASTSTLVPLSASGLIEREKGSGRQHFLTRHKNKLKDKDDHFNLALSSASSNSRPIDPSAPQSLYSFVPSSPAPTSAFDKSISGLDLRHGGRALREKRKQERSAAAAGMAFAPSLSGVITPGDGSIRDGIQAYGGSEWLNSGSANNMSGPASGASGISQSSDYGLSGSALSGANLAGVALDDAWPPLQARLLNMFEGEDLRTPIEDFNRLVSAHLQRCIQRRAPSVIIEDLRDLLKSGFSSLDQTLRQIADEKLVPNLVEMWLFVFGTILPFIQAVFLPLDLEFKGRGPLMTAKEAGEFWGSSISSSVTTPGGATTTADISVGHSLDVRTLVLLAFRDTVIAPRHATLLSIFSRLSLDSINALPLTPHGSPFLPKSSDRPGTAASSTSAGAGPTSSSSLNPAEASFTSQSSTLLDSNSASLGARSRATSNTSAGSFHSSGSQRHIPGLLASLHPPSAGQPQQQYGHGHALERSPSNAPAPPMDSSQVTEIAGRMLQCMSVLAGLHGSGGSVVREGVEDEETVTRKKMEQLAKELKLNWLGRGRTGRNRRGFVGTRIVRDPEPLGVSVSGLGIGVA